MPSPVEAEQKLVLHYMPERSFGKLDMVDISPLNDNAFRSQIVPVTPIYNMEGFSVRTNLDGLMYMNGLAGSNQRWYAQIFHDGTVEIVNGRCFSWGVEAKAFHPRWVEEELFYSFQFVAKVYEVLGLEGRVSIFMTALGLREYSISTDGPRRFIPSKLALTGHSMAMGRDPAYFNEVTVDALVDARKALRPAVEQLWNAGGYPKAGSYNDAGEYVGYDNA